MAEEREMKYDIQTLTNITRHKEMWQDYNRAIRKVRDTTLTKEEHKLCTSAIAAMLMFNSAQRPGTVLRAKLSKFQNIKISSGVYVISIKEHKL